MSLQMIKALLLHSGPVGEAIREILKADTTIALEERTPDQWKDEYGDMGTRHCPKWISDLQPNWLILGWWPKLVHSVILSHCKHTLNIHNSMLPWCRGKHPNFWSIVEQAPYGVSLHEVTAKIDAGPVYVSGNIAIDWTDTGESLHRKSQHLAVELFQKFWPAIRDEKLKPVQPTGPGSFHEKIELEEASRIPLGCTTGRDVLNIIRARQAYGHAAWFVDKGIRYEVAVNIKQS